MNECLVAKLQIWGGVWESVQTRQNLHSIQCSGMPRSSIKMLGKPAIGKILHAGQELDNAVDKFALKVVQLMKQSVIYRASTCAFCGYRAGKLLQTPVCRNGDSLWLVFSCSSKVKISRLKELLESKIRQ